MTQLDLGWVGAGGGGGARELRGLGVPRRWRRCAGSVGGAVAAGVDCWPPEGREGVRGWKERSDFPS